MKIMIAVLMLAASQTAHAELEAYLDLSLATANSGYATSAGAGKTNNDPGDEPYGSIEAGLQVGRLTLFVSHTSSLRDGDDRGVEMIGVRIRAARAIR